MGKQGDIQDWDSFANSILRCHLNFGPFCHFCLWQMRLSRVSAMLLLLYIFLAMWNLIPSFNFPITRLVYLTSTSMLFWMYYLLNILNNVILLGLGKIIIYANTVSYSQLLKWFSFFIYVEAILKKMKFSVRKCYF